jgi:ATP-dependent 26S proteasome regulatory subunit
VSSSIQAPEARESTVEKRRREFQERLIKLELEFEDNKQTYASYQQVPFYRLLMRDVVDSRSTLLETHMFANYYLALALWIQNFQLSDGKIQGRDGCYPQW